MRGITPGAGGTQNLARAIGERRAKELILSGVPFSASEAETWGLVNRVLPPEHVMEATLAIANRIAGNGPLAVRQVKQAIHRDLQMSLADGLAFEIESLQSPGADGGPAAQDRKPRLSSMRHRPQCVTTMKSVSFPVSWLIP